MGWAGGVFGGGPGGLWYALEGEGDSGEVTGTSSDLREGTCACDGLEAWGDPLASGLEAPWPAFIETIET